MCENENIKSLLSKINSELPALESTDYNNHGYNIFSVLEVEKNEVIMCRMLADLLNPKGQHGCGDIFLRSFLEKVIKFDNNLIDDIISFLRVTKEYQIDSCSNEPDEDKIADKTSKNENSQSKRIDIVIHGAGYFIPIEVKIGESEHGKQCLYYYNYAYEISHKEGTKIYYLTKYGTHPENSWVDLGESKCQCIAFGKVETLGKTEQEDDSIGIVDWLINLIEDNIIHSDKIIDVLRRYITSIEYFTGVRSRKMEELYATELLKFGSKDITTGIRIAQSFNTVQDRLIAELFAKIDDVFPSKLGVEVYVPDEGMHWTKIKKALSEKKPFTCFKIMDYFLYVRIEDRVWAELRDKKDKRVGQWIYLPTGSSTVPPSSSQDSIIPNYTSLNDAAINLHDKDKMGTFIEESIAVIQAKLLMRIGL